MYESETKAAQKALLVAADCGEWDVEASIEELARLAESAGAEVVGQAIQQRKEYDRATLVGRGKLAEIRLMAENLGADLLIFDHELTAANIRNLENATDMAVIDRTMLILDIFASRAKTRAGKLQVELAQYQYRLPRLEGLGKSMSRLGGGIGTRGPGESKLETDRRHIRRRIQYLQEKLEHLSASRELIRARRKKEGIVTAAIVGYTNAGKSTLLNRLTAAGVLAEDQLFATLDPTARALLLPDGRSVMLIDTVGFVRRLPHQLVEAFKSTLEEVTSADILLNVCDISSGEADAQTEVTRELLKELGADKIPMLNVLNKCDLVYHESLILPEDCVLFSAVTGEGLEPLLNKIAAMLKPSRVRMTLLVPYSEGGLISDIREKGSVLSEEFTPEGTKLDAMVDVGLMKRAQPYQKI
ncbi:MAG TPA: GTPase HflX [Oscillospiraceae bacterium]|nr:GTPase HflX [Oscillospiraceae bacterium]